MKDIDISDIVIHQDSGLFTVDVYKVPVDDESVLFLGQAKVCWVHDNRKYIGVITSAVFEQDDIYHSYY